MRTSGKVKKRLKQAEFKHQKKYLDAHLKRDPCNCKWNSEQRYLHEGTGQLKVLGMCMFSVENPTWGVDICEVTAQAQNCPHFSPPKSKEALKEDFGTMLEDEQFVSTHCKDVAALRWVLNGDSDTHKPWYSRFFSWFSTYEGPK